MAPAFITSVRLRTWFILLVFPILTALMVLLGGAVWATRQRIDQLEQLKRDVLGRGAGASDRRARGGVA